MGDPNENPKLPPGCRFYPSEEQLLCYYLTHKNNTSNDRRLELFGDVINEVDLYNYNPFDLPDSTCFRFGQGGRKRHWYCYVAARVLSSGGGGRRRAGGGYWKRRGGVRDVVGGKKVVVGTRRSFVFYLGGDEKKNNAVRTDWVMYEYALVGTHKDSFFLCRVFVRSCSRNNGSEHVVSSCGEGSVATVRHIGIQHNGAITSGIGEGIVHDDDSVDKNNEVLTGSVGAGVAGALSSVQVPPSIQPDEPVTASGLTSGASVFIGCFAAHLLRSILEEDYIELDDLACPLSDIDIT
ncbi:NAC domain-containing protein 68-like [Rhododendron vialii]|uniref:NAC domain-containing protein 68-like n=1 Tax=Rhododendron vialii TaxID=182163 RepID=UPI00265DE581|nr:NAC domain-containing protein 68-like [Rhododendron vialii]